MAAEEVRYLLDRGYPSGPAVRFVSDHHRLPMQWRFVLTRVVVPSDLAASRKGKRISLNEMGGRTVAVDGYNVLITVESLLVGAPVYLCDDGFLRDVRGIFRRYRTSDYTTLALSEILSILKESGVRRAELLFDQQISRSGELAAKVRGMMADSRVFGCAKTAKDVDRRLKLAECPVATGDGAIVDQACQVVDLPAEVAKRRRIEAIVL
ncbi:DUF434 domain-containing protein [Methanocrinis sp.]|uniref:DUF434 domain-containing protein n=1 Tax=Methanocrinis sp. TaxID=3101522 RepID=UPI003D10D79E